MRPQRTNEDHFRRLVDLLEQPSIVANARQAINAMLTPQIKTTNSRPDRMTLRLGDPIAHPDSSITIFVDVKKATTPAAPPSMKQMSMRGFERVQAQAQSQSHSQSQAFRGTKRKTEDRDRDRDQDRGDAEEDDEEAKAALKAKIRFEERKNREMRAQMNAGQGVDLGKLGVTFDKTLRDEGLKIGDEAEDLLASHLVVREPQYFYRPSNDKGKQKAQDEDGDEVDQDGDDDREAAEREHLRSAGNAELTDAYYYGGTLVPVGDLEDDVGTLTGNETGMEIVSFMKESDVSPARRCHVGASSSDVTDTCTHSCATTTAWATSSTSMALRALPRAKRPFRRSSTPCMSARRSRSYALSRREARGTAVSACLTRCWASSIRQSRTTA